MKAASQINYSDFFDPPPKVPSKGKGKGAGVIPGKKGKNFKEGGDKNKDGPLKKADEIDEGAIKNANNKEKKKEKEIKEKENDEIERKGKVLDSSNKFKSNRLKLENLLIKKYWKIS